MLSHIVPAAICVLDASRSHTCIRARAERLRDPLLDAYARAACYWAENHYEWSNEQHAAFASALLLWAVDDDPQVVVDLAARLRTSPGALSHCLHALVIVATFETGFVPVLAKVWPLVMEIGLTSVRDPASREAERLVRDLMPSPTGFGSLSDPDAVLANARASWFSMHAISEHIQEWLARAAGEMLAVDALVGFLWAQPIRQQAQPGLEWVQRLIVDDDGTASTSGFLLAGWLSQLRESSVLDTSTGPTYRSIVDALV